MGKRSADLAQHTCHHLRVQMLLEHLKAALCPCHAHGMGQRRDQVDNEGGHPQAHLGMEQHMAQRLGMMRSHCGQQRFQR